MDDTKQILALAKSFFDALEQGDVSILRKVYAPDVEIWHNTDGLIQTLEENETTLKGFVTRITDRKYGERRLEAFPGGFVQQHVLSGMRKDGERLSLPACIVCKVKNGRITRLDEYFDSARVDQFRKVVA
ncbi:MAG TPA: nuclear transport factor 2 family protein [Bradyrhizobium sp.]|jgi:ketosteroid isomerase-like protein